MHVLASCTSLTEAVLQRLLSALLPVLDQQVMCGLSCCCTADSLLHTLHVILPTQDLDVKNSEGETPLMLAKKQGNEVVVKALKAFGTRPLPLSHSSAAPSTTPANAQPVPEEVVEDFDETVEPARTCFPNCAHDRSSGSKDRVHIIVQRLLEIARKMMRMCLSGSAALMRQSLLEWNACMSQCVHHQ